MPNTSSSKKRLRQNETRKIRNRAARTNMRNSLRKVREAVTAGDKDQAQSAFKLAQKKLDRAASKNLIHRNAAARTKARLNRLVKTLTAA